METKYYNDIKTSVKYIKHILEMEIKEQLNEHVSLYMTGIMDEKYKDEKEQIINAVSDITVSDDRPFFCGKVTDLNITTRDNVHILEITAKSYSYLMDIRKNKRSFQDESMSYRELFETIMSSYKGGCVQEDISRGAKIPSPVIQYLETDWQFIKRMASHFNCAIYQTVTGKAPVLKIGVWGETDLGTLNQFKFKIRKEIESYERLEASGCDSILETDAVIYEIEDYKSYDLGSKVSYQNKTLYIKEKATVMEKGIKTFYYKLAAKNGMGVKKMWNEAVTGISLPGKVIGVDKDQVKLHLHIDAKQEAEKARYFSYTTVYTSNGNAGWYCMPELGDTVNLYFPSKDETAAVAVNSLRENDRALEGMDSSVKIFRTASGKELKFSEDGIKITCSNAVNKMTGEKNITYIELSDKEGIKIFSTKPVAIHSDEDLELSAGKELKLSASDEICLECKTSQIVLNEAVDIAGKVVKIN